MAIFRRLAALPGFSPAVPFMAAAVLTLPLVGAGAIFAAPSLTSGNFRAWEVLAVNHLVTLGWGTLAAMGALHQLFPAMLGASIRPGRAATAQFALAVAGMISMVAGFLARVIPLIVVGGLLYVAAVLLFILLLLRAVHLRRRWTLPATGVALALGHLVLTASWGLLMGINWHHRFWPGLYTYIGVGTHASLGLAGWFAQLVISASYYLLPRFMNAREIGDGRLRLILPLLNAGVAVLVIAALASNAALARAGVAILSVAGVVYAADLWRFLRGTRGEVPDLTTHHWWAILLETILLSAWGIAWAAGLLPAEGRRLAAGAGVFVLLGWMTLAIMGQLYKVTPFLMWFYRFARGMTPLEVPRLPAPYYPREGVPSFYLTAAGGVMLAGATAVGSPPTGLAGGLCLLAGGLGFWYLMAASWIRAATSRPPS